MQAEIIHDFPMKAFRYIPLLVLFSTLCFTSCSQKTEKDQTIEVSEADPEMEAAIAKARETLPQFWAAFENPKNKESDFCLKVEISDRNGVEHFWMNEIERKTGKIFGSINNDPNVVQSVKLGQRMEIPEDKISDWLFYREDKMVGNFTLRVLLKKMPREEAEFYQKQLSDP
jgi:uncharacterized protein YegJ (DUF2314 family)